MDNEIKPTPEELAAEKEALQDTKEEEIRAGFIKDYGFDPVDDLDKINKLVAKEVDNRKKLSTAIKQKITHRTTAEELGKKVKELPPKDEKKDKPELDPALIDKRVDERLEQRDLDALPYSEELKKDIQKLSKNLGISVKQALKDPYIDFKIKEEDKVNNTEEATIKRNNKTGGGKGFNSDSDVPPDVDMSTPEGREKYDKWKNDQIKKGR